MADSTPSDASSEEPTVGPAAEAGLTVAQYEWHVWDTAKNQVHAAAIYALFQVLGIMRVVSHPWFREPGAGWWREMAVFVAGFLGAWAVFYSTMLRDAGLRSLAVTILVPVAAVATALIWFAFPTGAEMTRTEITGALALLSVPGPVAWAATMRRWRIERRRAATLLASGVAGGAASSEEPR